MILSRSDRALQERSKRAQLRWERVLRAQGSRLSFGSASLAGCGSDGFRFPLPGAVMQGAFNAIAALPLELSRAFPSGFSFPHFDVRSAAFRRLALVAAGVSVTSVSLAATAISKGYIENPEKLWETRISERTQSPIYGRDNTLIGSVGAQQSNLSADQAREYAYIPLQGDLPQTYLNGLLKMENQNYLEGGWRNVCGLDIPATLKRWVVNFGAGGSTLSMQLARELKQPEWGHETNFFQKIERKFEEIGASCRLHNMLTSKGGDDAFLKMYASYAPTFQGNGTLRGIEAGSRIVFDVAPHDLTDAQQLILAAAARKPLTLLPPGASAVDCNLVYPKQDNPFFDPEIAKANVARAVQCQVTNRALFRAHDVLQGDRLEVALRELRIYQKSGIQPANPFQPIPAKRLINLASRTAATMPAGLLSKIKQEAEDGAISPGEPLYVTMDAVEQHQFQLAFIKALDQIQRTPSMQRTLCLPLVSDSDHPVNLPACGEPHDEVKSADVLAVKVDTTSGGLKEMYASSPLLMNSKQSIGSTAKWIVIAAALAEGYEPSAPLCPKTAWDGDRRLKRVAVPEYGYDNCGNGRHLMTLEHATATSDNLAYYQLAQKIGGERLSAAASALGLGESVGSSNLAYELSFGSYGATPRDLISASQALIAVAYGIKTSGQAPRALSNTMDEANPIVAALNELLPRQAQRDSLRQLLEAPVRTDGGTLAFLKTQVTAGKSGTVQSTVKAPDGRLYNHGKISVTYQQNQNALSLFFVGAPLPSIPLAQHDISAKALMPAYIQLLKEE